MRKELPDWHAIEKEYRAGQLSLREIGRQYGVSHTAISKVAKRKGWARDLKAKIEKRTNEKLEEKVSNEVTRVSTPAKISNEQIIEEASDRNIQIIEIHQNRIKNLRNFAENYLKKVLQNLERLRKSKSPLSLEEGRVLSIIDRNATNAEVQRQTAERRVYGLNDEKHPDKPQQFTYLPPLPREATVEEWQAFCIKLEKLTYKTSQEEPIAVVHTTGKPGNRIK